MVRLTMVEFPSNDPAASAAFFDTAFGLESDSYGPRYEDVHLENGQTLGFQGDPSEKPASPLTVIEVNDLSAARAAIEAAGGTITVEPFSFPGGRRLHFREPGGNELAVWVRE